MGHIVLVGRRYVEFVVQPAIPPPRNPGRFRIPLIKHPATDNAQRRINLAALRLEVTIALIILPNEFAMFPCMKARPDRRTIPPCKNLLQQVAYQVPSSKEKLV